MALPPSGLIEALADRYRFERELGRGGMAIVYLAHDLKHRRPVAIKVLHPELSSILSADRFRREIDVAVRLTHPNILPLHDSGQTEELLYYVMPYVESESLRDRLERGSCGAGGCAVVLRQRLDRRGTRVSPDHCAQPEPGAYMRRWAGP